MHKRQVDPEQLAKQFKRNPTLQEFLQIRWAHPDIDFDVSYLGGIDHLFALEGFLENYGIPARLYAGILDADEAAIKEMSMLIMEDMYHEANLREDGETHVAARRQVMPQHLRDWLVCCMLGSLSWNDDRYICIDLIALLHFRLMAGDSRIEEMVKVHAKRHQAAFAAGNLKARGIEASFRKVAEMMGVQPSTVKRWFASEAHFQEEGRRLASWFDETGSLKNIAELRKE